MPKEIKIDVNHANMLLHIAKLNVYRTDMKMSAAQMKVSSAEAGAQAELDAAQEAQTNAKAALTQARDEAMRHASLLSKVVPQFFSFSVLPLIDI